jgi:high-affinity iron transporter
MENALQFELTGDTDEGSHTNLATVRANIDGDRIVLNALRPLIEVRDPGLLSTAESQLTTLATLLDTYRDQAGVWTPVESLTLAQHQKLDADTDAALATLDQIPAQLEQASGDSS